MTQAEGAYGPILFDLDGTLADTYPGSVAAAEAALGAVGLPKVAPEQITALTGRGVEALVDGLLAAVGAAGDPTLRGRTLERYVEAYEGLCADGATTYPGMLALLGRLTGPLALLTNKPRRYTEKIAARLGFGRFFATIVAGDDAGDLAKLKPNPWPISEALRRLAVKAARPILVGDTATDVLAAQAAGVPCCVVRWGHGGAEAVKRAGLIVEDVAQLERLLLGRAGGATASSGRAE